MHLCWHGMCLQTPCAMSILHTLHGNPASHVVLSALQSQEASHSVRTSSLGQASSAAGSHGKSSHASVAHPTRLPITHDLILKALERQGVRLTHQDRAADEKLVAKQTHLHLNGKGITHIDALKWVDFIGF